MRSPAPTPVARLRRPRLLISGCGDVGLRLLGQLASRLAAGQLSVVAVARDPGRRAAARAFGARALATDLDHRTATARLGGLAGWTIHLAPPPASGRDDPRLGHLITALGRAQARARSGARSGARTSASPGLPAPPQPAGSAPPRWALISTSGVYGDRGGAWTDETCPAAPATDRARRRLAAEQRLRAATRRQLLHGTLLRAPGIYARERLPVERLRRGEPVPVPHEDGYTNHIHADDLARTAWFALLRGRPGRVINASDDTTLKMGDWFDRIADACGLAPPPRLAQAELASRVSPAMLSFMAESRRLSNRRLKRELRVRLRWPDAAAALSAFDLLQSPALSEDSTSQDRTPV
ncbi:MAG: NAD-dependent epimerase/dehydratase family protein [Burkholderiaceae bacterium]